MKQLWCALSFVAAGLLCSTNASADVSSGALLQQMNVASQSLNYELSFISINKQGVESLRYRHARLDNQALAQLLQMDGPRREVVQRGNEISYFEPGLEPFTLNGNYIVDSLPSLVYTDFKRLSPYYDFISVGRTRIAVTVRATATLSGWTKRAGCRCASICSIAMAKLLSSSV